MTIDKVCRDCNKMFSISPQEQDWIASKGFKLYTRCKECRRQNRLPKNDDENSVHLALGHEVMKASLLAASTEILKLKAELAISNGERAAVLNDLYSISFGHGCCSETCANKVDGCVFNEDRCKGYKWRGVLEGVNM